VIEGRAACDRCFTSDLHREPCYATHAGESRGERTGERRGGGVGRSRGRGEERRAAHQSRHLDASVIHARARPLARRGAGRGRSIAGEIERRAMLRLRGNRTVSVCSIKRRASLRRTGCAALGFVPLISREEETNCTRAVVSALADARRTAPRYVTR